jgi:cytoskeletal protein CcmA (bactofilin family)
VQQTFGLGRVHPTTKQTQLSTSNFMPASIDRYARDDRFDSLMVATAKHQPMGEITTLLGRGATFEGKLTFDGTVRIDGRFKGEVFSDDVLVIGEGAHVEAEIDIGEVIIQGTVVGNVKAKRSIEIHAPGRVKGDLHTPSLQIDKGVIFEGRSFMENAAPIPRPGAAPSPPVAPKTGPTPVKP